jgi:hypothetical protein
MSPIPKYHSRHNNPQHNSPSRTCCCECAYHTTPCKCFCPYHEAGNLIIPETPEYYIPKDFPSLPPNGWFKPCRYPDCYAVTAERVTIDQLRYPCCRICKKRDDCISKLKYIRYYSMVSSQSPTATKVNLK